jgi:endoribonuclease LACTB2
VIDFFAYRSTRCFIVPSTISERFMAVDAGWPGTLSEYRRGLKSRGVRFEALKWAIVTHFHLDHAGLLGEFLRAGIECYVFEGQVEAIAAMEKIIARHCANYAPIEPANLRRSECSRSRALFESWGIEGEAVRAPGHSEDGIAFVQGDAAIVGDLPPIDQIAEDDTTKRACWDELKRRGVHRALPSHAALFDF